MICKLIAKEYNRCYFGLNNLKVVAATSKKYATAFGFTEDEVRRALEEFGLEDMEGGVRHWYDGYRFGDCGSIYNPWSIINFLDEKRLAAYWSNTSSNGLVGELIRKGSVKVKQAAEDLLNGKAICAAINEEVVFNQLGYEEDAVWSILLASGYLKVAGARLNEGGKQEYLLSLTNFEVRQVFDDTFAGGLGNKWYPKDGFSKALLGGNLAVMDRILNDVLISTRSYYDSGAKPSNRKLPENFYHGFVLGLIASLRNLYAITSNRESGFGRYDVLLEPIKQGYDGIILEFKVYDAVEERDLEATVDAAIRQILDRKYAASLEAKGIGRDRIRVYGFAFAGKKVLIGGGNIKGYEAEGVDSVLLGNRM